MTMARKTLTIGGRRTSVKLEPAFWLQLEAIAADAVISIEDVIDAADAAKEGDSLASTLRVLCLEVVRQQCDALRGEDAAA